MRVLGIDPGFASTGLAVVEDDDTGLSLLACSVVKTAKQKAPRAHLRVSLDDSRRLGELGAAIEEIVVTHGVGAVAIEVFTVIPGKMAGGASKTAMVYGAAHELARTRGLVWLPLVPTDLKRALCGRMSASKADMQQAVTSRLSGAEEAIASLTKGKREHAADAMAAAVVGHGEVAHLAEVLVPRGRS